MCLFHILSFIHPAGNKLLQDGEIARKKQSWINVWKQATQKRYQIYLKLWCSQEINLCYINPLKFQGLSIAEDNINSPD